MTAGPTIRIAAGWIRPLGAFDTVAANEPGSCVEATLYHADVTGEITPRREIDDAIRIH